MSEQMQLSAARPPGRLKKKRDGEYNKECNLGCRDQGQGLRKENSAASKVPDANGYHEEEPLPKEE